MPDSASVGRSGKASTRSVVVTPSARTLPDWISATAGGTSLNMNCTCPPTTSCSAGAVPL